MGKWAFVLMAGTALMPAAVHAQAATGDASSSEIIVTAQRYEQRLQDVPMSVGVVTAKDLAARGVTSLKDMQFAIPGLSTFDYGASLQFIQLRGMSNIIGSSTVGLYLDETPITTDAQDSLSIRLYDMERVEVLRGPQATLYGQGSMGGTIRYIPAAPKLDAVSGSFEGELSDTRYGARNYKAIGVANLPLSTDKVGLRLVGGYERLGGYIDNVATGEKDVNAADVYTVRANLLAKPSDRLTLSLLGLYQKTKQAASDFGQDYETSALIPTYNNDRYTLVQAKAAYDVDFAELSVTGSYIDRRNQTSYDLSPFYVALLPLFGFPPGFIDRVGLSGVSDSRMYYGEVRLSSQSEGPLGWQIGATYRDYRTVGTTSTVTAPNPAPFDLVAGIGVNTSKSYAVYGELNYAFTPELKAIVGARYFSDRKRSDSVSTNFGVTSTDIGADTFHTLNPRFNLSYAFTPQAMVYANVAKGFRSGGFNAQSTGGGVIPIQPSYDPDRIWSYEVGTKQQLFDGKLILDASLYHSKWSQVQSSAFAPGSTLTIVTNSGDVSGWGVDLSATARPTSALTLTATYGWNNLEYDRAVADKIKGDPVDAAVRKTWSASLDFRPPLTDSVNGIFRVDYQHAGKSQFTLRNFGAVPVIPRPARDLVNLRVGAAAGPLEIALFANNLFDENAPSIVGPFGVIAEDLEQRPRVIGISASTRF